MDYKKFREHTELPSPEEILEDNGYNPEELGENGTVVLRCFDFSTAIVGISRDDRVIYDYEKMIEHLINYENMDAEEAIDYISYNFSFPMGGDKKWPVIMYSF